MHTMRTVLILFMFSIAHCSLAQNKTARELYEEALAAYAKAAAENFNTMPPLPEDIDVDHEEYFPMPAINPMYTYEEIREMEQVFQSSPVEAQNIVNHLTDPHFLGDGSYRYALFVGLPGSGKTTMAKAIAYKAGWDVEFIASGNIVGNGRNEAVTQLRAILYDIVQRNAPVVVVIDELNELLENADNEHYDTSATAKFLWQFLDAQNNNHNFFMISTMNRDNKLPQAFKSRMFQNRIEFCAPTDMSYKREIFCDKLLANGYAHLDPDVDSKYLDSQLEKLSTSTGRDLMNFACAVKRVYRTYDTTATPMIIGRKHIEEAVALHIKNYTKVEYTKVDETDADRQERHFIQRELIENFVRFNSQTKYETTSSGVVRSTTQTMSEAQKAALHGMICAEDQKLIAEAILRRSARAQKDKETELDAKRRELDANKQPWWHSFTKK